MQLRRSDGSGGRGWGIYTHHDGNRFHIPADTALLPTPPCPLGLLHQGPLSDAPPSVPPGWTGVCVRVCVRVCVCVGTAQPGHPRQVCLTNPRRNPVSWEIPSLFHCNIVQAAVSWFRVERRTGESLTLRTHSCAGERVG